MRRANFALYSCVAFLAIFTVLVLAACSSPQGVSEKSKKADAKAHKRFPLIEPVTVDKVLVVWEENHSYAQAKAQMPYLWELAQTYGYATNSRGNYHPSQPNYIVAATGSNRGITSNSKKLISGSSIFDRARSAGRTAKTTADGMGEDRCRQSDYGAYRDHHNPETVFKDYRKGCESYNYDYRHFSGDAASGRLGNIHFLIPSNRHNSHDASLKVADDWLKKALSYVFAGPDWASGRLAIIVTFDEDDKRSNQQIMTVVIHPSQQGKAVNTRLDQVSLHKTLARAGWFTPLAVSSATDLATAFGLPMNDRP